MLGNHGIDDISVLVNHLLARSFSCTESSHKFWPMSSIVEPHFVMGIEIHVVLRLKMQLLLLSHVCFSKSKSKIYVMIKEITLYFIFLVKQNSIKQNNKITYGKKENPK